MAGRSVTIVSPGPGIGGAPSRHLADAVESSSSLAGFASEDGRLSAD
jgi:hypothetical protein